jgi:succinate dehydrogenase/fumarate reductase flavoprotein subunit
MEIIKIARNEAIHYDRNYFRTEQKLTRSLGLLDGLWATVTNSLHGEGVAAVRAREAAAIVATARWSFTAALHRRESRGMHARMDFPALNPAFAQRQILTGLDRIGSNFETIEAAQALVA